MVPKGEELVSIRDAKTSTIIEISMLVLNPKRAVVSGLPARGSLELAPRVPLREGPDAGV